MPGWTRTGDCISTGCSLPRGLRLTVERVMCSPSQDLLRQRPLQGPHAVSARGCRTWPLSLHPELAQTVRTHRGLRTRCHARPARAVPRELGHPAGLRQPSFRPPHAFLPVTRLPPLLPPVPALQPPRGRSASWRLISLHHSRLLRPSQRHRGLACQGSQGLDV